MTTTESTTELAVLKTDSRGRVRTPAEQRETLLDAFEQSAMSACKRRLKSAAGGGPKVQLFPR